MSNLSSIEKMKLEGLFEMGGGYVLNFSNWTFEEFIRDTVEVNIYDDKYDYASGSKANRLRAFWNEESNYIVSRLISDLLEYWKAQKLLDFQDISQKEQDLFDECQQIAQRLKHESTVEHIDTIQAYLNDKDSLLLAKSIREGVQQNKPEAELDRLHTYVVKYARQLCDKHGIVYDKHIPLHSLFGMYVKYLRRNNIIKTEMTERILKSSISMPASSRRFNATVFLPFSTGILS